MTDLSFDCLEKMDQLVHQSSRGYHILFNKEDILNACTEDEVKEEDTVEMLQHIQDLLYKFIQSKSIEEKIKYFKSLDKEDSVYLIRAYFKIVDNSILNKMSEMH